MNEREIYYLGRRIRETRKDIAFEKSKSSPDKNFIRNMTKKLKQLERINK